MGMSMEFFGIPDERGDVLGEMFINAMKSKVREIAKNPERAPRIMMDVALSIPVENERERYLTVTFATKAAIDLMQSLTRMVADGGVEKMLMLAAMMSRQQGQA